MFIIHAHQKKLQETMIILNTVKTNISGCCFFSFHNLMNPSKSIVVTKIALTPWFDVTVPDSLLFPFGVCVHAG